MSYWYCPNCKIELDGCHVTYEEKCEYCGSDVLSVPETISQEELDELIKAKADGRLVVLPCKVGDTLFLIKHGYIEEAKVRTIFIGHPSYNRGEPEPNLMMIRCTNFDLPIDAIGKTAFLSREAAEKALGGVSDGN